MPPSSYRFSHHAQRAITHANTLAVGFQHPQVDTGHLLVGVMLAEGSIGAQIMQELQLSPTVAGVFLKRLLPRVEEVPDPMRSADTYAKALEDSSLESEWLGSHYVGTEHLLLGITRTNPGNAVELLRLVDITPEQIRRRVRHALQDFPPGFSLDSARANVRVSELSRRVLNAAEQIAFSLEHPGVGIGHLLLALARERRGVTGTILEHSGLDHLRLETALNKREHLPLTSIEPFLQDAVERSEKLGSHYVGADHLLLSLSLLPPGVALLQRYGAAADRVNRLLNKHLKQDT